VVLADAGASVAVCDIDPAVEGLSSLGRAITYLVSGGGDIVNITMDHVHTRGYPVAVDHRDAPDCKWASSRRPPLAGIGFDVYDGSK
jgi:hypothetical protein